LIAGMEELASAVRRGDAEEVRALLECSPPPEPIRIWAVWAGQA
jgi:hypothetical protein